jgi:hypothetical protein
MGAVGDGELREDHQKLCTGDPPLRCWLGGLGTMEIEGGDMIQTESASSIVTRGPKSAIGRVCRVP